MECEHFVQKTPDILPNTKGCQECEVEKTPWVAIRMCLTCGHVGCCDSSVCIWKYVGCFLYKMFALHVIFYTIFHKNLLCMILCVESIPNTLHTRRSDMSY